MRWLILLKFLKIRAGYRESTFSCLRKYIIIRVYIYVYVSKKLEEKKTHQNVLKGWRMFFLLFTCQDFFLQFFSALKIYASNRFLKFWVKIFSNEKNKLWIRYPGFQVPLWHLAIQTEKSLLSIMPVHHL